MSSMLRAPLHARSSARALRSATAELPPPPDLPSGQLPAGKDALLLISHYRKQPAGQKKSISDFCCKIYTPTKEPECLKEGGCVARDSACLLFQVKRPYLQAGLVTISDQAIVRPWLAPPGTTLYHLVPPGTTEYHLAPSDIT